MRDPHHGAILVLPTTVGGQRGPVASWLSTAGWANAIRRTVGAAWIVTPSGFLTIDEVRAKGSTTLLSSANAPRWRRHIPVVMKTAMKDVREFQRARSFHVAPGGPWREHQVDFVWQRHELFQTAGFALARELRVPSVCFVPAPLVWQADQWHVHRPGWHHLAEQRGEARVLVQADVVAAGSEIVAAELLRLGVEERRIVITRTGFDPDVFSGQADPSSARESLGLGNDFVVGWVGSFRGFHELDLLVEAVAAIGESGGVVSTLLLVGDGPERSRIEMLATARGVRCVTTGTVPQRELPRVIAAMDVAVVLAGKHAEFHYSPLKLAEYLASGVAVVAPHTGAIPKQLTDGVDARLVAPGNVGALAGALRALRDHPEERSRLACAAREAALQRFSWDAAVSNVVKAIKALADREPDVGRVGPDFSQF